MNLLLKLKIALAALLGLVYLERRQRLTNDLKGFAAAHKMTIFRYLKILVCLAAVAILYLNLLSKKI